MARISEADQHAQLMETAKKFERGFKRRGKLLEKCKKTINMLVVDQGMNRVRFNDRELTITDFLLLMIDEELEGKCDD